MKKALILGSCVASAAVAFAITPTVKNVAVRQDSANRVLVDYTLENGPAICTFDVLTNGVSIGTGNLSHFTGDICRQVGSGDHSFAWRATKAWPGHYFPAGSGVTVSVKVTAWSPANPPDVMVIDLLVKSNVLFYASLDQLPGGVTNRLYKTDKLVLRKIPAEGVIWRMGSPTTETGYNKWFDVLHTVELTKDYYMGVYEVTQSQWFWIKGNRPSYFNNADFWETRPVEQVFYAPNGDASGDIRGVSDSWPTGADPHAVGSASFFGKLRSHCGIMKLDLPTDAQFEFACRAGSPTALYGRKDLTDENLAKIARYAGNGGYGKDVTLPRDSDTSVGTAEVGSYEPNEWGLYDMLGNVFEWCIDSWKGDLSGADIVVDPVGGSASSNAKAFRGQSFQEPLAATRCGSRGKWNWGYGYAVDGNYNYWTPKSDLGFRVSLTLE